MRLIIKVKVMHNVNGIDCCWIWFAGESSPEAVYRLGSGVLRCRVTDFKVVFLNETVMIIVVMQDGCIGTRK